jgi:hypothetical protein
MALHVRLLWGLLDPKDVSNDPPMEVLQQFSVYCPAEEQLYNFQNPRSPELVSPMLVKIGTSASISKRGRLATQIRLVEEHMLQYIQSYVPCSIWSTSLVP